MSLLRTISLIIGIGTVALTIFGAVYFTYAIYEFTDYRVVDKFQNLNVELDINSDVFTVTDRKLVSTVRGDAVYPEDELYYHFQVNNKSDKSLKVNYTLEKSKGGIIEEPVKSGYFVAKPNVSYPTNIDEIFLKDEGSYDLKLTLDLLFFDDIPYDPENIKEDNSFKLKFDPPSDKIDVLSHTAKLQADANILNFYGFITASIIGGSTIIALSFSVYYSRKEVRNMENQNSTLLENMETQKQQVKLADEQNIIIKQQYSEQNRPWLAPTEELTIKFPTKQLTLNYKNYGKSPALNIEEHHEFSNTLPTREYVQKMQKKISNNSILVPGMESAFSISNIGKDVMNILANGGSPLFLSIRIDFDVIDGDVGQYGVIFEWYSPHNTFHVKDEWVE